jgi:hypothetical protein
MSTMRLIYCLSLSLAGCAAQEPAAEIPGAAEGTGQLPCDVAQILTTHCDDCHRAPPVWGALMPLLSYGDLTSPSLTDPTKSNAQVALARVLDPNAPMPPSGTSPPLSQSELQTFQAWVQNGTPSGGCTSTSPGKNPYGVAPVCTSGRMWTLGTRGSPQMEPGQACIDCHSQSFDAPSLLIGGTAYPTAHEPDDCDGESSSTKVIVTDSANNVFTMSVSATSGNFYTLDNGTDFEPPITAKIVSGSKVRVMQAAQMSGDCNSCHTQDGTMDAPGRILLP